MPAAPATFSVIVSSDPQYPWYDEVLPPGLKGEEAIKKNSARQISQQYASMNQLQAERQGTPFPVQATLINGDLTAFGHGWQMDKYKEMLGGLKVTCYPALGNHDYANNVDDCANNGCATSMVKYMYSWLQLNSGILNYDFVERSYYKFPELRTDYSGSMSYSFNLGKVHFVQLQNYPSYTREWNSWNAAGARRDFFFIQPSFDWLRNDLAIARNRGDVIIVSLHDYGDHFKGEPLDRFNGIMNEYGVSAVFAGHIHEQCEKIGTLAGTGIPYFRSGAAAFQDYLVLDIDTTTNGMTVRKRRDPDTSGNYEFTTDTWPVALNSTIPNPPLHVPPVKGWVTFFNEGGFVARFELKYRYQGEEKKFETGHMQLGNKKTYSIPPAATDVRVKGEEQTGLVWEGWRTVFDKKFDGPPNNCFRLYGTTLHPKWNNDCS